MVYLYVDLELLLVYCVKMVQCDKFVMCTQRDGTIQFKYILEFYLNKYEYWLRH